MNLLHSSNEAYLAVSVGAGQKALIQRKRPSPDHSGFALATANPQMQCYGDDLSGPIDANQYREVAATFA